MANPMEFNEVIRNVCRHLSFKDLLTFSELNKSWNYECRVQLRDHHNVIANLTNTTQCYKTLKCFNDRFPKMHIIAYTGIAITLADDDAEDAHGHGNSRCSRLKDIDRAFKNILPPSSFVLKWLSIDCSSLSEYCPDVASLNCSVARLVIKLLESHGETLEYLAVAFMPHDTTLIPHNDNLPAIRLPNLKSFECCGQECGEHPMFLILQVVCMAPNLVNLIAEIDSELLEVLPSEAFKTVRSVYYDPFVPGDLEMYGEFAAANPKLTDLDGNFSYTFPQLGAEEAERSNLFADFWNHLMRIVRSSAGTLESLHADPMLLIMLTLRRCPPLRKVDNLRLPIPCTSEEIDKVFAFLRHVDFRHLLPSLKYLELSADYEYYYQFEKHEYYQRFHFPSTVQPLNSNITEIDMTDENSDNLLIPHLVNLFPFVTKFAYRRGEHVVDFPKIWSSAWPALKKLKINGKLMPTNLDAVFCGISPEEAASLLQEPDEFLELVNIVPTAAAINRLKELEILDLWLQAKPEKLVAEENPGISRVTSLLMLRRMPKLKVDFYCPDSAPKESVINLRGLKGVTVNACLRREDSYVH